MAILNNNPLVGASGNQGGYNINNSLRFRSSASAYLSRTPASAGNRRAWTWSGWIKRGTLGSTMFLFGASSTTGDVVRFLSTNDIQFYFNNGSNGDIRTSQVFRDPSAWYHLVFVCDTANATASNRMRIYVNGSLITAFQSATYPAQNYDTTFNTAVVHNIAGFSPYLDCYLADVNFIDGQALTPSSFGETDTTTGVWKPKAYSGTYGTNGFYLKFSDIATTSGSNAGLGKDFSGNTNYWTTNNISVTSGTTYDAMTDSPTNTSATVANYPVFNVVRGDDINATYSEGNLKVTLGSASVTGLASGNMNLPTSGKWYWEIAIGNFTQWINFGILVADKALSDWIGFTPFGYSVGQTGNKFNNDVGTSYASAPASNDVWGIAFDATNGKLYFAKNGTWQASGDPVAGTNAAFTGLTSEYIPAVSGSSAVTQTFNFGQRPFTYTPPTGYLALNTFNLPNPTILQGNRYMDATLYTGNGSTQVVVNNAQFKPDLVWVKTRVAAAGHQLVDSVRGVSKPLGTDNTAAEYNASPYNVTAFNSNGFTVADISSGANGVNGASGGTYSGTPPNYVAWQWQAGQGSTSSNTSGSITSTVSVNTTAGFSIVTYTGTGANATVGHGLGVAPRFIIVKQRGTSGGGDGNWIVGSTAGIGWTGRLILNGTFANEVNSTHWNNTAPTSTVFSLGTSGNVNGNTGSYVAYCWAEISGFSKFGSYTGNGSTDGTFVFTNLKPRFIMIKRTDSTSNWTILDTAREGYNVDNDPLYPNLSNAEGTTDLADILSNGFKLRSTDTSVNANAGTYIYACFSSNPFKNSTAV